MVEGHNIDKDGLVWTLKLRDGLRFHDNEPVLARDVVASIRRFAARISFSRKPWQDQVVLCPPSCRNVWHWNRHTSRSAKLLAAVPTGFYRQNTSAALAPPLNVLRDTSRGATA